MFCPLLQLTGLSVTELIWDGKYQDGKRVAPTRISLPFQTVETVNESAQQRQRALDLFSAGRDPEWRNRLIWGDKKYVLPSLLEEFAGKVNLVYIDPPFNVGADFSFTATIPDNPDTEEDETTTFPKEPSVIEMKAYRDTWGRGMESYLQWFYETVVLMRELLAENGSIYVHLDWHVGQYAKVILDEVFGVANFQSEIIWQRTAAHNDTRGIGNITDLIFYYTNSEKRIWNPQFMAFSQDYLDTFYRFTETDGRRYRLHQIERNPALGIRPNLIYEFKGYKPRYGWMVEEVKLREFDTKGMLVWSKNGKPQRKIYLNEEQGRPITNLWDDIPPVQSQSQERVGYATQKPEALLERIIKASSNLNDLVLDVFGGSGTTATVAEKNDRRWITCDLGRFAIHTTRKRLLSIDNVRPFVVQNLGKYERQVWQAQEFQTEDERRRTESGASVIGHPSSVSAQVRYREFILDLYDARPISGYVWLHGVKSGRMVHVGAVDSPVSVGDVTNIVTEFKRAIGTGKDAPATNGVDVLGWDFAFELNEVAKQQAAQANINVRFMRIPREVLDKKAVEQGDVRFFELAALSVGVKKAKRDVTLTLEDFIIPPDDVPQDVQKAIKHWSQWIDYWAIDWDNKGDTFHNEWQTYRTRKNPDLQKSAAHTYDAPGEYTIVVKVIDILGNDTTKTLRVKV